jgi:hypothetical protein
MSETKDKNADAYIDEAKQHLDKARELKPEGPDAQIRALEKAQESVGHAIETIANEPFQKKGDDLAF